MAAPTVGNQVPILSPPHKGPNPSLLEHTSNEFQLHYSVHSVSHITRGLPY